MWMTIGIIMIIVYALLPSEAIAKLEENVGIYAIVTVAVVLLYGPFVLLGGWFLYKIFIER